MKKTFVRDLIWLLPASLGLAALLSLLQGGNWLTGWLAFAALMTAGLLALTASWRWAGGGRKLVWILALAFLLRLGTGAALYELLPVVGYLDSPMQQAGYSYSDAYDRDGQSWTLAQSGEPIWIAFSKQYSSDQYGGALAVNALVYRYLSPDMHRPLLTILLSALIGALGVSFLWKAARRVWGEKLAAAAAWIFAFYPESLLLGSVQLREPFLITFIAIAFWGVVDWRFDHRRLGWLSTAGGLLGMLLYSPGVAIFTIFTLAGWIWFGSQHKCISWKAILIGAAIALAAALLLWAGLARGPFAGKSPWEVLANWLKYSSQWNIYLLERGSGRVQQIFDEMPAQFQLLFVIGYGLAQPVLPAAFIETSLPIWHIIGGLRAAGWYALAPFLLFSLLAVLKTADKTERRQWLWLWAVTWAWILLSAYRGGGDQWDNPRYRAIFMLGQALLAARAWVWQREARNPWLGRLLTMEVVFLAFFTQWYLSRYYLIGIRLLFWQMAAVILAICGLILSGGLLWDFWRARRRA